jgi:hypothetical protein
MKLLKIVDFRLPIGPSPTVVFIDANLSRPQQDFGLPTAANLKSAILNLNSEHASA